MPWELDGCLVFLAYMCLAHCSWEDIPDVLPLLPLGRALLPCSQHLYGLSISRWVLGMLAKTSWGQFLTTIASNSGFLKSIPVQFWTFMQEMLHYLSSHLHWWSLTWLVRFHWPLQATPVRSNGVERNAQGKNKNRNKSNGISTPMSTMYASEWQSSWLSSTLIHACGWGENRSRVDYPESLVRPRRTQWMV